MYIHIYIYIYIYISTERERERGVHIYIYICMYVCVHVYIYIYNGDLTMEDSTSHNMHTGNATGAHVAAAAARKDRRHAPSDCCLYS